MKKSSVRLIGHFLKTWFIAFCMTGCTDKPSVTQGPSKEFPGIPDSILLARADSVYEVGERLRNQNKMDSSLITHRNALEIREKLLKNDIRLVNSYFRISRFYTREYKYEIADKYLENARRIAEAINEPLPITFEIYRDLITCKREMRDFPLAISMVQKLIKLAHGREPENKEIIVSAYDRLASIYHATGQYDKAIENWEKAVQITPPDSHSLLATLFFNAALAYTADKKIDLSLRYFNKSIKEVLIWAGPESTAISSRFLSKAFALLELNQIDSARFLLKRSLDIRRKTEGEKSSLTWGAKYALGEFHNQIGEHDSAAWYHHQSLISLVKGFHNPDLFSNPIPTEEELNTDLIRGLVYKAAEVKKIFDLDTLKVELLELSLNTYLLADSVYTLYRRNILYDDPLMEQMNTRAIPYPEILDITFKLLSIKRSNRYLQEVLNIMERSRTVILQNSLARAEAYGSAGIPDLYRQKENELIGQRAGLLQKLSQNNIHERTLDSLNEILLRVNDQYLSLQQALEKINPSYFAIKYESKIPVIGDVKKRLTESHSILIEYLCGPRNIYVLRMGSDTTMIKEVPLTPEFNNALEGYIHEFHDDPEGTIEFKRFEAFCNNSFFLYNTLIKDLLYGAAVGTRLIVSAHGRLSAIPFEALISKSVERNEVNYNLDYLIKDYPVSYAYSSTILLEQSVRKRNGNKLLAFGYGGKGHPGQKRNGLNNLPGTEKEISAIKDVMLNSHNQYYLEGEASETKFKLAAVDYDLVHLAIHGEGDTVNSLNSRLIFRSDQDTVEDGYLYAHELYKINLDQMDLAVLSACESGVGKQQEGEGILSIARGFAYSGCPSLVISLWKIDDRTSAQVMGGFYQYLSMGNPLDISLARTKIDYLTKAGEFNSHPAYWAAFLQVGDTRELDVKDWNLKFWIIVAMVLLAGLLAVAYSRFRAYKKSK